MESERSRESGESTHSEAYSDSSSGSQVRWKGSEERIMDAPDELEGEFSVGEKQETKNGTPESTCVDSGDVGSISHFTSVVRKESAKVHVNSS